MVRADPDRFTYRDYCLFPDDGLRYEILDGRKLVSPAPAPIHQRVSERIQFILATYARKTGAGEVLAAPIDVVLSDDCVLQPDLIFILSERSAIVGEKFISEAPDLVVEIASPSTAKVDRNEKLEAYGRFGVPEYWIVEPERASVAVFRLRGKQLHRAAERKRGESLTSEILPGLAVDLEEVFSGPARGKQ